MLYRKQDADLKGKTVNIEVYLFIPKDGRPRSYVWGFNGNIVSAGMMATASAVVEDIVESYRERKPEYISMQFPIVVSADINGRWNRQLKPVLECDIVTNFKKALSGYSIIGIAPYEE